MLDQPRAHAVVNVVRVVGDLVGQVADLRLQPRPGVRQKALPHTAGFVALQHFGIAARAVLQDAFAGLEGQVQPIERCVALLQHIDHAQALEVVLEPA